MREVPPSGSAGRKAPRPVAPDVPKPSWRLPRRPLGPIGKWVAVAILALFVLNFWLASRSLSEPPRIGIPYSPLFLDEVRQGNVDRITSKGTSLQGQFRSPVRYPPTGSSSRSATRFSTLIPTFADTAALSKLLEENKVVINAEPLQSAAAWWERLLYGFGHFLVGLVVEVEDRVSARSDAGRAGEGGDRAGLVRPHLVHGRIQ